MEEIMIDKYKICFNPKTGEFYAKRNDERWRELTGDNLVYALFAHICKLENKYDYKE